MAPSADPILPERDFASFRAKAEAGDAIAQALLGACYECGRGVTRDDSEAFKWNLRSAEQGYNGAQFHVAVLFKEGRGTARDLVQAAKWLRIAGEFCILEAGRALDHLEPEMTQPEIEKAEKLASEYDPKPTPASIAAFAERNYLTLSDWREWKRAYSWRPEWGPRG